MQPGKHSQLLSHCPKLVWLPAVSSAVPASHGFQLEWPLPRWCYQTVYLCLEPSCSATPTTSPSQGGLGLPEHST